MNCDPRDIVDNMRANIREDQIRRERGELPPKHSDGYDQLEASMRRLSAVLQRAIREDKA